MGTEQNIYCVQTEDRGWLVRARDVNHAVIRVYDALRKDDPNLGLDFVFKSVISVYLSCEGEAFIE